VNDKTLSEQDINALRAEARLAADSGNLDRAIACWEEIEDAFPGDSEAAQNLAQLPVLRSRREWGLEPPAKSAVQDAAALLARKPLINRPIHYLDERNLQRVMNEGSEAKRTPLQQLEFVVRDSPSNPDYYLKLASLYLEKGREYDAERLLSKARDVTDDPQVQELWEDVTMARLESKVAAAEKQFAAAPSEQTQTAYDEARRARDSFETRTFATRCEREPENAALRLELGLRYKQAGKLDQAYECFVAAIGDDMQKPSAAFEMAECLQQTGQLVEALQYYRICADSAVRPEQQPLKRRAYEQAAQVAEGMNLKPLANRYRSGAKL
jgi:tetratricopeptide (TPR) repeat protein